MVWATFWATFGGRWATFSQQILVTSLQTIGSLKAAVKVSVSITSFLLKSNQTVFAIANRKLEVSALSTSFLRESFHTKLQLQNGKTNAIVSNEVFLLYYCRGYRNGYGCGIHYSKWVYTYKNVCTLLAFNLNYSLSNSIKVLHTF
jgi:hypothetical protein